MPRPKDDTLRARLIDAATCAFADRGYAATTIVEIGAEAAVTKGGVYLHFRSKEQLFFAAVDHWRGQLRAALDAAVLGAANQNGAGALAGCLRCYLEFHFSAPHGSRLLRVLATELAGRMTAELRGDARFELRNLRARLRELVQRGVHDGSLFAGDAAFTAFLLVALVEGVLQQWLTAPIDAAPFCDAAALVEGMLRHHVSGVLRPGEPTMSDFRGAF